MPNVLDLRDQIRNLVDGRIRCANCGNDVWEQFLYVGDLPNGGMAGCKKCAHVTNLDQIVKGYWKPSASDLAWTRALIGVWAEQAIWETSFATFQASVKDQTLTVITIKRPDIIERELGKVRTTFEALGWRVLNASDQQTECTCDLQKGTPHENHHHPDCDLWDGHESYE